MRKKRSGAGGGRGVECGGGRPTKGALNMICLTHELDNFMVSYSYDQIKPFAGELLGRLDNPD